MRRFAVITTALGLVLAAGCGGTDGDAVTAAAPPDLTATPTSSATADAEVAVEGEATPGAKEEAAIALADADAAAEGPTPTAAAAPTTDPTPTGPPTEGLPGGRYVQVDGVTADGQGYAVDFTPFGFTPLIGEGPEDFHVHFFFDTVAPEDAGTNGPDPGEWFLYDGPSPFTGYTFADRPPAARQMCALVADAAHGVTVGSGNCVTLP